MLTKTGTFANNACIPAINAHPVINVCHVFMAFTWMDLAWVTALSNILPTSKLLLASHAFIHAWLVQLTPNAFNVLRITHSIRRVAHCIALKATIPWIKVVCFVTRHAMNAHKVLVLLVKMGFCLLGNAYSNAPPITIPIQLRGNVSDVLTIVYNVFHRLFA